MNNTVSSVKPAEVGKGEWLKKNIIPLLMLLLAIAITVVLFFYRSKVAELGQYGYLGVFLVSLAFNATIILPVPGILLLLALGATFNPVLVGLVGATGGSIGEITGYMVGYSGRGVARGGKMYTRLEGWMKRWGVLTIFIFAVAPYLPLDLAGIVAGALRLPIWKFLLACWLGKTIKYIGLALAGAWGWEIILRYLG